ncbi:MAG: HEPN domain-containing protein [Magnetococcales bacterium]|nr:HEPN domain-containing protein [Magnetococcales bacterium]
MTPWDSARRLFEKADQDRKIFHAIKHIPDIEDESICFHAQQAVEKCLKAVLMEKGVSFRRTHDLDELVDLIIDAGITFPFDPNQFSLLNPFAVQWRYEDLDIGGLDLVEAEHMMEKAYFWVKGVLDLEV